MAIIMGLSVNQLPANETKENILPNGSFEQTGPNDSPSGWICNYIGDQAQFSAKVATEEAYDGKNSLKMEVKQVSEKLGCGQCFQDVTLHKDNDSVFGNHLNVSYNVKLKDIKFPYKTGWQGVGLLIDFYDAGNKKLQSCNIFNSLSENLEWKKFNESVMIPENTAYFRVLCRMVHCAGTAYFNNIRISYDNKKDISAFDVKPPYVLPTPWQEKYSGKLLKLKSASILAPDKKIHPTNLSDLEELLTALTGGKPALIAGENEITDKTADLLIAGIKSPAMENCLSRHGLEVPWSELGDEGYFLNADNAGGQNLIIIAANTDQGISYGIQTLKQLVANDDNKQIYQARIIDRPLFKNRGLYTGPWWGPFKKGEIDLIKRMNSYKMNFLHIGGLANNKIQGNFRAPLTDNEKNELRDLITYCKNRFVRIEAFMAPAYYPNPPITFSSEEDLKLLLDKIDALCELGLEDLSLCFDDLSNKGRDCLYNDADRKKFRNHGEAQAYLIKRVYDHLKQKDKKYVLRCTLTTYYHGADYWTPERLEYIKELSSLPEDIPFIVCQNGFTDKASVEKYLSLAKRKPMLMGTWARFEKSGKIPAIIPAFGEYNDQSIYPDQYKYSDGLIYLVLPPRTEDCAMVSFVSSADFAWNPAGYDPKKSAQKQILSFFGNKKSCEAVSKVNKLCFDALSCPLPDKGTKQERIDFGNNIIKQATEALNDAHGVKIYDSLEKSVSILKDQYQLLLKYEDARDEYPFTIRRCDSAPKIDGLLDDPCWENAGKIANLKAIGKELKDADPDTEVRVAYDDKNFYISFVCHEPEMQKIVTQCVKGEQIFKDDCIEIFLDTRQNQRYFHIAVNSNNIIYDGKSDNGLWHGKYVTAATRQADKWQVEIAIPFETLGITSIKPGARWNVNFCRTRQVPPKSFSTWAYLPFSGFNEPQRFETIDFK